MGVLGFLFGKKDKKQDVSEGYKQKAKAEAQLKYAKQLGRDEARSEYQAKKKALKSRGSTGSFFGNAAENIKKEYTSRSGYSGFRDPYESGGKGGFRDPFDRSNIKHKKKHKSRIRRYGRELVIKL